MRKIAAAITLITALLITAAAGIFLVRLGKANPNIPNYLPKITINSDGSITPETRYINRTGGIYTLTANIIEEYSIDILCNNIVFDGAEHRINVSESDSSCLRLNSVTNVTVKNLEVISRHNIVILDSCSNCVFTGIKSGDKFIHLAYGNFNTIAESNTKIGLLSSKNNLVLRNNITGLSVFSSSNNNFSQNNILCSYVPNPFYSFTDHWANGSQGNYWNDYQTKYPHASEIGNTGIGNMSYVIDADNIDHFPLMYRYDIENDVLVTSQPKTPTEPFPVVPVAAVVVVAVVAAATGLLVYFKKRKRKV